MVPQGQQDSAVLAAAEEAQKAREQAPSGSLQGLPSPRAFPDLSTVASWWSEHISSCAGFRALESTPEAAFMMPRLVTMSDDRSSPWPLTVKTSHRTHAVLLR